MRTDRIRCVVISHLPIQSYSLTHWGWVTHVYVSNLTIIGSDNGLSPGRRQAIAWTNVGILLIGPLATNFSKMLIEIHTFSFKKIHLKMSFGKWRSFCLGFSVLKVTSSTISKSLSACPSHYTETYDITIQRYCRPHTNQSK